MKYRYIERKKRRFGDLRRVDVYDGDNRVGYIEERSQDEIEYRRKNYANRNNSPFNVYYYEDDRICILHAPGEETTVSCIAAAKRRFETCMAKAPDEYDAKQKQKKTKVPVTELTEGNAWGFFPTPFSVAGRMLRKVNWDFVSTVLEPSAGKGDLLDALTAATNTKHGNIRKVGHEGYDMDCIELDQNLRAILKDKQYRVVGEDFFSFTTEKQYDLILMNPPFANGDKHLMRAISLLERNGGGQIVCLLNASTIKNPYNSSRKALLEKLNKHNAKFDYMRNAFKHAERPTDVEVVIISLSVPAPPERSRIVDFLKKAAPVTNAGPEAVELAKTASDWIERMLLEFEMDTAVTVRFLREYQGAKSYMPGICLHVDGKACDYVGTKTINDALKSIRWCYWRRLLKDKRLEKMVGKMTKQMESTYDNNVKVFQNCDFTRENIKALLLDIQGQLRQGIQDEIMRIFEKFTSYDLREGSTNIHYYTGWKTNNCYKIGKRVIVPMYDAFGLFHDDEKLSEYECEKFLDDIQKVLDFLDRGQTSWSSTLEKEIKLANDRRTGFKKVSTHYFDATFYRKGTVHIVFKPDMMHVIDRMNVFAAMQRNWLPPYYGKVRYEDMDEAAQTAVLGFHGDKKDPKTEYAKVCLSPDNYLTNVESSTKLLTAGDGVA